jgi:hypothetical protein
MTGQDIVSVGIGSSAMSGVLTTGKLARMNALGMIMKAPASNNNQAEVQPQH